jgi:putative ABC transport system ATP-binding protein
MIILENVTKIFNETKPNQFIALKDINLHIQKNQFVILEGISGSGKSTLLSIIASYLKPTSGNIKVCNKQIAKLPDIHLSKFRANCIGFVFQSYNLFDNLTVHENLIASVLIASKTIKNPKEHIDKILKKTNIKHKEYELVQNLSGGEKQRVAFARALVNDPQIILCDEPTASLDVAHTQNLLDILKQLHKDGKTIIVATHDPIFRSLNNIASTIFMGKF